MKPAFHTAATFYDSESLSCGCTCLCSVLSESYPSTQSKYACALNFGFNRFGSLIPAISLAQTFWAFEWTIYIFHRPLPERTDTVSLNPPPEDEPNLGFAAALSACLAYVRDIQERYSARDLIECSHFSMTE